MISLSSISGFFSLLNNPTKKVQTRTLNYLYKYVDNFWPEIAQLSYKLEDFLDKNKDFPEKIIIYAILSKVYYHLDDLPLSFDYAMMSNRFMNIQEDSLYIKTLKEYAIKTFIEHHNKIQEKKTSQLSEKITVLIGHVIDEQLARGDFENVLGLAVDSKSHQLFGKCLTLCLVNAADKTEKERVIELAFEVAVRCASPLQRSALLAAIYYCSVQLGLLGPLDYARFLLKSGDIRGVADILVALSVGLEVAPFLAAAEEDTLRKLQAAEADKSLSDDSNKAAFPSDNAEEKHAETNRIICRDVNGTKEMNEYELYVFQIAFDVAECCDHRLLAVLLANYCVPYYADGESIALAQVHVSLEECLEAGIEFDSIKTRRELKRVRRIVARGGQLSPEELREFAKLFYPEHLVRSTVVRRILVGKYSSYLNLQFLYSHCSIGAGALGTVLEKVGNKSAISSGALIVAHGFARCGTAQDGFVRRNTSWFAESSNWAKFSAVASLGVVHKGNVRDSEKLLAAFLPKGNERGSPYQAGGALYALGLIHCNNGVDKVKFLSSALRDAVDNEIVQHGACLGLGLCSISMGIDEVAQQLKDVLFQDNAISGEAAAIALGLNNMGNSSESIEKEVLEYARETKHEKISRGAVIGLALMAYEGRESCNDLLKEICEDENEIIRYGGCFVAGLAFIGTEDSNVIRLLLRLAVTDPCGDVRRSAIMSLVFVFCRSPEKVPPMVKLFAESFNHHSRYGAAIAIGLSSVGTGSQTALKILEPLLKDKIDFVQNAAMMATSLVLLQSDARSRKHTTRHIESLLKIVKISSSSDFSSFQKAGAIIALGLFSLGDRNCSLSLLTQAGMLRPVAAAGMLLFMHAWYWFPFYHFLSLAAQPTAFIGITPELKLPRLYRLFCTSEEEFAFPSFVTNIRKKRVKPSAIKLSIAGKVQKEKEKKSAGDKIATADKRKEANSLRLLNKKQNEAISSEKTTKTSQKEQEIEVPQEAEHSKILEDSKELETSGKKENEKPKSDEQQWVDWIENRIGYDRLLSNPCRVSVCQKEYVGEIVGQRYSAVRKGFGIVLLRNSQPSKEENLATNKFIHEAQQRDDK